MKILGVVMAGGRNTRYGGLKAFAEVGGVRIVDRVIGALRAVSDDIVVVANDIASYGALALPVRPDDVPNAAALGGLLTALRWARERGAGGVVTVACDMPFVPGVLLKKIVEHAMTTPADVTAPESGGRRGVEPLCAFYATTCIPAIEGAIAADDLRMIGFYENVNAVPLPIDEVRRFGDPAVLFMNVNTPAELDTAQALAAQVES